MSSRDTALLMLKSRRAPGEIQRATGMSTGQIAALAEVQGLSQTTARSGGFLTGIDPTLIRGLAALMWAEQNAGHQRVRRQASRVRDLLGELSGYQSRMIAENGIRGELAQIDRKLKAAQCKLSRLGTTASLLIRDWAREQGMTVSPSGVVSAKVIDAFEQQHHTTQLDQRRAVIAARLQREIASLKRSRTAARRRLASLTNPPAAEVRAWARQQGLDVSVGGQLPAYLTEAYKDHQAKTMSEQAG
ncbi:Lsr2 family DNA-binding protein [Streptomyces griseorubiginosus]|uniref:Lsr2 family DNA-binding protein n=1 Tax=Streptomyces griseorubiginosus TaxID=67304 RepID=UPI0036EB494A